MQIKIIFWRRVTEVCTIDSQVAIHNSNHSRIGQIYRNNIRHLKLFTQNYYTELDKRTLSSLHLLFYRTVHEIVQF